MSFDSRCRCWRQKYWTWGLGVQRVEEKYCAVHGPQTLPWAASNKPKYRWNSEKKEWELDPAQNSQPHVKCTCAIGCRFEDVKTIMDQCPVHGRNGVVKHDAAYSEELPLLPRDKWTPMGELEKAAREAEAEFQDRVNKIKAEREKLDQSKVIEGEAKVVLTDEDWRWAAGRNPKPFRLSGGRPSIKALDPAEDQEDVDGNGGASEDPEKEVRRKARELGNQILGRM